jgi:uncharacterized protein with HEPN domain
MAASANPRARLLHILEEIDGVSTVIEGMDYLVYHDNYVAIRVVERALEIISEACAPCRISSSIATRRWIGSEFAE